MGLSDILSDAVDAVHDVSKKSGGTREFVAMMKVADIMDCYRITRDVFPVGKDELEFIGKMQTALGNIDTAEIDKLRDDWLEHCAKIRKEKGIE